MFFFCFATNLMNQEIQMLNYNVSILLLEMRIRILMMLQRIWIALVLLAGIVMHLNLVTLSLIPLLDLGQRSL